MDETVKAFNLKCVKYSNFALKTLFTKIWAFLCIDWFYGTPPVHVHMSDVFLLLKLVVFCDWARLPCFKTTPAGTYSELRPHCTHTTQEVKNLSAGLG